MGKKEDVPNRQYSDDFRREAGRAAESPGGHPAAKPLGIPQSTCAARAVQQMAAQAAP